MKFYILVSGVLVFQSMVVLVVALSGGSPKYRTLAVPACVAQNVELFTHVLSGITIIFIPDKGPKFRRHLATLVSCSAETNN